MRWAVLHLLRPFKPVDGTNGGEILPREAHADMKTAKN